MRLPASLSESRHWETTRARIGLALLTSLLMAGCGATSSASGETGATPSETSSGFDYVTSASLAVPAGWKFHFAFALDPPSTTGPPEAARAVNPGLPSSDYVGDAAPPGTHYLRARLLATNLQTDRPTPGGIHLQFLFHIAEGNPPSTLPAGDDPSLVSLADSKAAIPPSVDLQPIPAGSTVSIDIFSARPLRDPVPQVHGLALYSGGAPEALAGYAAL